MTKVAIITESTNDANCLISLLKQVYPKVRFTRLLPRANGSKLDSRAYHRLFEAEFASGKWNHAILVRDLDALATQTDRVKIRKNWFKALKNLANGAATELLHIYELEALILADIAAFNAEYKVAVTFTGDPSMVEQPKEFLNHELRKLKSRRIYREADSPKVFRRINHKTVLKRCAYFSEFHASLIKDLVKG